MRYEDFLAEKSQVFATSGLSAKFLSDSLFDFQRQLVEWAIARGRAAIFADCGLGKTLMQLVWAQNVVEQTNGNVLILTPLAVSYQTIREAAKFGIACERSSDGKAHKGITVTNYQRLERFDVNDFAGVVADECFSPDTLIEVLINGVAKEKYIKDVRPGDLILNASGVDRVKACAKRRISRVVILRVGGKEITCSENHPFLTLHGWKCAKNLQADDYLVETETAVRLVREGIFPKVFGEQVGTVLREVLFSEMADEYSRTQSQNPYEGSPCENREEESCLVSERIAGGDSSIRENPQSKSYSRIDAEDDRDENAERNFTTMEGGTRREQKRPYGMRTDIDESSRQQLASSRYTDANEERFGNADSLQVRLCQRDASDRDRSGRRFSSLAERTGREERPISGIGRVDGIEILEQVDPRLEKYRDESGSLYFYDLEATRHPSFSVNGILVHNSGVLKSFDSVTRNEVTEFARKLRYRLLCTATAAPNDYIELGNSSEALGYLGHMDMLSRFFKNDHNNSQSRRNYGEAPKWRFKHHAETPFWKWVCSWARAMRKPSDLGFDDTRFILPELTEIEHVVGEDKPLPGRLFPTVASGLSEQREEQRHTMKERCEKAAELVDTKEQALIWCNLNDEGDLLANIIPDAKQVKGSDSDEAKEVRLMAFADGELRVLVTKPKIGAWGLNLQRCAHIVVFPTWCYDEQTEVLSRDGWKTFDKVNLEDDLATVNQETLAFEWESPSRVVWGPYTGPMIHLVGQKNFDLLVTPNHNLFVQRCPVRYREESGNWKLRKASEIAGQFRRQEFRMLSAPVSADGKRPEQITIPLYGPRYSKSRTLSPILAEDFVRLAGWYLTEGCAYGGQIVICQTEKNLEYRAEIINLLTRIGLPVYHKNKNIRVCNIDLTAFLIEQFGSGSYFKHIPRWVKDFHPDLLTILRDTMIKGDGSATRRYYKSFSAKLRDDFQEICLKTGIRASVHNDYVSLAWKNIRPSIHEMPERVDYNGMIGCATVSNHTLIVRRNGIPVVSGNSYEAYYQGIRRCWRFGQTRPVRVDIVTTEGGKRVLEGLQRKAKAADRMFDALVTFMHDALSVSRNHDFPLTEEIPEWLSAIKK